MLLVSTAQAYFRLSHIPGPFFAKFTNLQRFSWVLSLRAHEIHTEQHRKYGPLVRFGPNMVSVGDPREIGTIYSFKEPWRKSNFYRALLMKARNKPVEGIFATQSELIHRNLKRPVSAAYSMSNLVSFEPYVDATMRVFCDQLESRFISKDGGRPPACNLSDWLQMFAFDVIGELTFSKRFGFLENGEDVDGIMAGLWNTFKKTSLVTQMPWLEYLWTNNPVLRHFRGNGKSPGVVFAMSRVQERQALEKGELEKEWEVNNRDFLSRFIEIQAKDQNVPPEALLVWVSSNITAGSDTTAIFLRSIFYQLLTHPNTLSKLMAELDAAADRGELDELATWKQTHELPYLSAVIAEAGRIHPPFGLPLERQVPAHGAVVCGQHLKGGTIVGMSAWAAHRDPSVFGDDCDEWNPDRWLCDPEKKKKMDGSLLTFGAGHRSCLGKNISLLEIHKVVPTLLKKFNFEVVGPEEGGAWDVQNRWFVPQHGFKVRLSKRQQASERLPN